VLLARWMGSHEFGIYVYVWTWVMLIGAIVDLGLASSAQRFIPDYAERGALNYLRGFLSGSRRLSFGIATMFALAGAGCIYLLRPWLDDHTIVPLAIACACLPMYGVLHVQDGIARTYNWVPLALLPPYILRPLIVIGMMGAAWLAGLPTDAATAIAVAAFAIWITALGQAILLNRRLNRTIAPGESAWDAGHWFAVSVPMFAVDALYAMLMHVDVLILKQFRSAQEVAVYFAALKTLSLIAFVYFAVAAATAHKFAQYHAAGDRARLEVFLRDAVRWTFWPSVAAALVILALGWPMLWLFGRGFTAGYHLLFIFAVGLLARAAIGPAERLFMMLGQQHVCAAVAAAAFAVNVALCLLLIPSWGANGAAIAVAAAFVVESILLFVLARRRLGLHLFVFGRAS
jgi:O-antigen/teichoic acid export membrane protein